MSDRKEYFRKRYLEIKAGTREPMKRGAPVRNLVEVANYEHRLAAAINLVMSFTANGAKERSCKLPTS